MTQLSKQNIQALFAASAKSNGKATARIIILKNYPYAESMITDEEMKAYRQAKPVMPAKYVDPKYVVALVATPVVAPTATPVAAVATKTGVTKITQARAIFSRTPGFSRADIIAKFMTELNMTKAGASTYYYLAQK